MYFQTKSVYNPTGFYLLSKQWTLRYFLTMAALGNIYLLAFLIKLHF